MRNDIVNRLQPVGVCVHIPVVERQRVVPCARLCLGGLCDRDLVAVRGDVVDRHLNLVLVRPLINLLRHCIISLRDPVVPEADVQLASGTGSADMHQRQCGSSGSQLQSAATRYTAWFVHGVHSLCGRGDDRDRRCLPRSQQANACSEATCGGPVSTAGLNGPPQGCAPSIGRNQSQRKIEMTPAAQSGRDTPQANTDRAETASQLQGRERPSLALRPRAGLTPNIRSRLTSSSCTAEMPRGYPARG